MTAVTMARPTPAGTGPGRLGRAIDGEHVRAALGEALGRTVDGLQVERVLFSKSRPPILHYRIRTHGAAEPFMLIGELIGEGAAEHLEAERLRLAKRRRGQLERRDSGSLLLLDDPGIVLRRPGLDSKLDGLRLLTDLVLAADLAGRCVGRSIKPEQVTTSLKAHRLGKRAVLAIDVAPCPDERHRLYVRLRPTTSDDGRIGFERHARIAASLAPTKAVRLPTPLGLDAEWGAAIYAAMPGHTPDFAAERADEDGKCIGRALCAWRDLAPADGAAWHVDDEIAGLAQWSERLHDHLPGLAQEFDASLTRVRHDLEDLPPVGPRACHRDFHEGQLLLEGPVCGFLDLDTWCAADPALDIGNLAAHVRLWELRAGRLATGFERGFLESSTAGGDSGIERRVAVWRRAALLRLAAIYAFTSEPVAHVRQLTREAGR